MSNAHTVLTAKTWSFLGLARMPCRWIVMLPLCASHILCAHNSGSGDAFFYIFVFHQVVLEYCYTRVRATFGCAVAVEYTAHAAAHGQHDLYIAIKCWRYGGRAVHRRRLGIGEDVWCPGYRMGALCVYRCDGCVIPRMSAVAIKVELQSMIVYEKKVMRL